MLRISELTLTLTGFDAFISSRADRAMSWSFRPDTLFFQSGVVVKEEALKRAKHRATVVSCYATCNCLTYLITSCDKYDSLVLCERHHVAHGTDLRHVRFEVRCICMRDREFRCIIFYCDSCFRAFVGIYHNYLWFSFLGNRRGFGSLEQGNARRFQRRHCARRQGL